MVKRPWGVFYLAMGGILPGRARAEKCIKEANCCKEFFRGLCMWGYFVWQGLWGFCMVGFEGVRSRACLGRMVAGGSGSKGLNIF